jgi:acyl-CoA synthetase (AMP-forming)/AMP-acid ligase II
MSSTRPATLPELLIVRGAASADRCGKAFTELVDGEAEGRSLTFAELLDEAQRIAVGLRCAAPTGSRVISLYPTGLDFITAFFGCVLAGMIAVPATALGRRSIPRLLAIIRDCQPALVLAPAAAHRQLFTSQADADPELSSLTWLTIDALRASTLESWREPYTAPDDIAFLQYTSGSTGTPKGVMVSHANVLANVKLISDAFQLTRTDVGVSWLPAHHDMGLIGKVLTPVYVGSHALHMAPAAFLSKPVRWLRALSAHRGTITSGPNFAYDLCARKIRPDECDGLDLSSVRVAMNGAEPVRADTLARFAEAFAPFGFDARALTPVYGLAEATLFVSGATAGYSTLAADRAALAEGCIETTDDNARAAQLVSVGAAAQDRHEVRIVDPDGAQPVPDNAIGEIWVTGASVAQGYWQNETATGEIFEARASDDDRSFMRTGDLGFIRDGSLYVTGRIKDLMIFGGRNVYPNDIEACFTALDQALPTDGCVAFSINGATGEELVVVQEVEQRKLTADFDRLVGCFRAELAEAFDLTQLRAVLFVRRGRLPRTTSGKLQRSRCRELFLNDELDAVARWTAPDVEPGGAFEEPLGETETAVAQIWSSLLGVERVGRGDDFFALGGQSLLAQRAIASVEAAFGCEVPLRTLFEAPTLAAFAARLPEMPSAAAPIEPAPREAPLRLSFAQQRLWVIDRLQPGNTAYNIAAGLELRGRLNPRALETVLCELVWGIRIMYWCSPCITSPPMAGRWAYWCASWPRSMPPFVSASHRR